MYIWWRQTAAEGRRVKCGGWVQAQRGAAVGVVSAADNRSSISSRQQEQYQQADRF